MTKIALFCPRLPRESEGAWQLRYQACRLYLRQLHNVDVLEFDTLEHLQINYRRHTFRRILVAQAGYYPLEFWDWSSRHYIPVLDVLLPRPEPAKPENSAPTKSTGRRYSPVISRRETRSLI